MLQSIRATICRSKYITVLTMLLRCTVMRQRLINQRVEACHYGCYGVFGHTHLFLEYCERKIIKHLLVLVREERILHRNNRNNRNSYVSNAYKSTLLAYYGFLEAP